MKFPLLAHNGVTHFESSRMHRNSMKGLPADGGLAEGRRIGNSVEGRGEHANAHQKR